MLEKIGLSIRDLGSVVFQPPKDFFNHISNQNRTVDKSKTFYTKVSCLLTEAFPDNFALFHLQKEQEISESLKASLFKLYDSINENLKESGYSVLCTPALVGANEHPEKPAQENINRDANITVLEKNPKRITSKKKEIEEEDIEKQKKHQPKNECEYSQVRFIRCLNLTVEKKSKNTSFTR